MLPMLDLESKSFIINPSTVAGYYIYFNDMTLPMVTCPLCCRPGFNTSDSLCSALVDVTTRKLCCPVCNHVVIGLDKFTIHMFSHSLNKFGLENGKATVEICEADGTHSTTTNVKSNTSAVDGDYNNCILKLQTSTGYKNGADEVNKPSDKSPDWRMNSNIADVQKTLNIPDTSLICFRADNGQIFALSPEYLGSSLKNVTINTQNYITNTNITTSTVQTSVVEKVQKRKYSQVFENENSENINKNCEDNSPDNYSNAESVNSWPSTPSVSSEADKPSNSSNSLEREFESCKDLLTKGDFSTLTDEIGELDIKKEFSLSDSMISDDMNDDSEDKKDDDRKKEGLSCELCPFVFPNKTILAMHKQLIHKKVEVEIENKRKLLICNLCPRTFSLRSSLMIHRKVAHAGGFGNGNDNSGSAKQPSPKPACHICGKFFKKEIHLAQHMKAHDEKQWQCTICSKTFTTKYFLKKHRRLHTGETPYKCGKCGKAFTFQQSYHKHLLYHNDEKPYCCAQCGRLFKELSTLHNHERIHSGEKPFSCETCGKAFRQRVSYLVHRRIHTGAMPYKCTACNKSFRYKISQRTHKCLAQPPGVVVRTSGSLVERLQAAMTKAGDENEQKPSFEKTALSQNNESPGNDVNRKPSSSNFSVAEKAGAEERNASSFSSPPSTCAEKLGAENRVTKGPEIDRIQIDKPQIYLLVKGPNEETYYQPLIISQTLGLQSEPKNSFIPTKADISAPSPRSAKGSSSTNTKGTRIADKDHSKKPINNENASSPKSNNKKLISSKGNNKQTSKAENSSDSLKPKLPEKIYDKAKCKNEGKIVDETLIQMKKGMRQEESGEGPSLNSKSAEMTMDEILRNLNCDNYMDAQSNQEHSELDLRSHKLDASTDMTMMEPTDMFSFVMSPSPSDRLGKLSLSSNPPSHQQLGIDSFDTPGVFGANILSSSEPHQDSLFDTISDDALKEFLFGTST